MLSLPKLTESIFTLPRSPPLPLSPPPQGQYCSYFLNVGKKLGSQAQLRQMGMDSAWDIEDLVSLGKKIRVSLYILINFLRATRILF